MWYDIIIAGVLLVATIRGAKKGFVWQLASIAALILCFVFAETASVLLAPHIKLEPPLNRWVTMFGLYVVCSFVSFAVARQLHGWIEQAKFQEFDRHLGSLFGFIKGAVFALVATFFIVTLSEAARAHVLESKSGYFAAIIMDRLHPVMPKELHDVLEPYIHQLDRPGIDLHFADHAHQHGDKEGEQPGHNHDLHTHTDHDHGGPIQGTAPQGGNTAEPAVPPRQGSEGIRLDDLIADLPGMLDPELRKRVLEALGSVAPEERGSLLDEFRSAIPGLLPPQDDGVHLTAGMAAERDALLREIAEVYADEPSARQSLIDEIQAATAGLPASVSAAVLRDWHADLLLGMPDPDPATDVSTTLDSRIVRQLQLAGVPLDTLGRGLQDRLRPLAR